ncbi:NUDIX domain-containing protein [Patescibacteria group bacterium]|nr:NUDIX domain-containing protein [Patescibacteria group bacterium]MCL5091470.1 NUDIX domain-containing protein [Patescibacteria group bacterium]
MTEVREDERFCVGQKAVILKGKDILLLRDPLPPPGAIDLPGGKIQVGERDFAKALQREVYEESRLTIKVGSPFFVSYWEFPNQSVHRNRGKKIFLVFYACRYQAGTVKISDEHDWFGWVDKNSFRTKFPRQTNICQAIESYFGQGLDRKQL